MNLAQYSLDNTKIVYFFLAVLLIGGILSFGRLGKKEDAPFVIKSAVIMTRYPGAEPAEVERLVTEPISREIQSMSGVYKIKSESMYGLSKITFELQPSLSAASIPQKWDELRRKVLNIQPQLPAGSSVPTVSDDFGDVFGIYYGLVGDDGFSYEEMRNWAERIKTQVIMFNPSYENIYVNNEDVMNEVKNYVSLIAPEKAGIVKLYTGKVPIFDNFSITKQIKAGFGRVVNYKHGAYLIIEHTEALHVVDVNSGNRTREKGQEANALDVNLGAADELARQLRLRDMGGIIVVDFIDMNLAEDRQLLYERMCKNMQKDRAKHNILPLSKFGLMQITRQRVRPAMDVNVDETCPTCFGTGKIKSSILFTDQLERKIDRLVNKIGVKKFTLYVNPYVAAFINKGFISLKRRWQFKYGFGFNVIPSQKLAFLQYEFYDKDNQYLDMQEEQETK